MNNSQASVVRAAAGVLCSAALLTGCASSNAPRSVGPILDRIEPERLRADVDTLSAFGTRHTLSDTASDTRGIGAARRWLRDEFQRIADASNRAGELTPTVAFDTHLVEADGRRISEDVEVINVMMTIPGAMPEARDRLYYVIAHYDSRNSDALDGVNDAPGANDDASGVALCLEIARVLVNERLDATVVLMPTAGEEQGLYGARMHAAEARAAGRDIRAVLSNDTVGDPTGPGGRFDNRRIRVFSEGIPADAVATDDPRAVRSIRRYATESDGISRQLARVVAEVGDQHALDVQPWLIFRPDRFLRGGDHTGFNEQGYAAIRFCEVYEDYDRQHQDLRTENGRVFGDLPEYVDEHYLAGVTRLNTAALIHLASAPSAPVNARIIVAELTNDTTLRWDASPEPDVAGYELVWRDTTSPVWTDALDVGSATEATVDLSKDNWTFGVRSYDREGFRSPVAFPRAARD